MRPGVTLYFIRHGETDWNAEARYQGQADVPMNDRGRAQARRNGGILKSLVSAHPGMDYVASPLGRTRETMEIVRAELGLDCNTYRTDPRLKEVHYGSWQGVLAGELPARDPEGLSDRARDPFRWRPHGGESYADLMARTTPWLAEVERDTVIVSHGGVSRTLRGALLNLDVAEIPFLDVPQDRVLVLTAGDASWL